MLFLAVHCSAQGLLVWYIWDRGAWGPTQIIYKLNMGSSLLNSLAPVVLVTMVIVVIDTV